MNPTPSKHPIPIGWQYGALMTVMMLLFASITAWLPMALFKLGLIKSLVLGMSSYPLYCLWVVLVYLFGLGVLLAADFSPSVCFDKQGIEIKTGTIIGKNYTFVSVGQITKIYLVHHAWLDLFVVQTTDGKEYVVGFVQCDTQTQQKLTDCFNHLFVQVTAPHPPRETPAQ
ncbi:TPA: hypothetical protein ACFP4Y_000286 [Neisseria bacilliformis]